MKVAVGLERPSIGESSVRTNGFATVPSSCQRPLEHEADGSKEIVSLWTIVQYMNIRQEWLLTGALSVLLRSDCLNNRHQIGGESAREVVLSRILEKLETDMVKESSLTRNK